jgi:hypothetical protein
LILMLNKIYLNKKKFIQECFYTLLDFMLV